MDAKTRKWIVGIAMIIVAILMYLVIPYLDSDPETKPDLPRAIQGVEEGYQTLPLEEDAIESDPAPAENADAPAAD